MVLLFRLGPLGFSLHFDFTLLGQHLDDLMLLPRLGVTRFDLFLFAFVVEFGRIVVVVAGDEVSQKLSLAGNVGEDDENAEQVIDLRQEELIEGAGTLMPRMDFGGNESEFCSDREVPCCYVEGLFYFVDFAALLV